MGEEAPGMDEYELDSGMVSFGGVGEDERVMEWETGLPGSDELTPLSQPLVPPGLAAAFRIPPEPGRTLLDVHRASAATVSRLRRASSSSPSSGGGGSFPPYADHQQAAEAPPAPAPAPAPADADADADSPPGGGAATTNKRPRLVWTPQLHKRFVDVVAHLGIKNAVPKTIMQLMNVEGLTRENVASHLQKYRLYVKRMRGLSFSNDDGDPGPSPSDHHVFASTPVPHSLILQHYSQPQQQVVPTPPPPPPQHHPYMYQHHQYHHRVPAAAGYAAAYPSHHAGHAADN